jgi:hypothetical protein
LHAAKLNRPAYASIPRLNSTFSLGTSEHHDDWSLLCHRRSMRVLIRIVKSLPAPLMDGFDVRGFHVEQMYDVESRLGRYLIVSGYAESLDETANDHDKTRRVR